MKPAEVDWNRLDRLDKLDKLHQQADADDDDDAEAEEAAEIGARDDNSNIDYDNGDNRSSTIIVIKLSRSTCYNPS